MFGFPHFSEMTIPVAKVYENLYRGKGILNEQLIEKTADVINVLHKALHSQEAHLPVSDDEKAMMVNFFNDICKINEEADDR